MPNVASLCSSASALSFLVSFSLMLLFLSGCAGKELREQSESDSMLENCLSAQGQRFLTYCASPEAAQFARRQHRIAMTQDEDHRADNLVPLPVEGAPLLGPTDAPITVHFFGDLREEENQKVIYWLLSRIEEEGETKLVFRNYSENQTADLFFAGALAAGEAGKFWDFVGLVLTRGSSLLSDELSGLALELDIEEELFQREINRQRVQDHLLRDRRLAEEVGVVSGPTLFINGRRLVAPRSQDELDELLSSEEEAVKAMLDAGLARREISWRRILHNYRPVNWEAVATEEEALREGLFVRYVPLRSSLVLEDTTEMARITAVLFVDLECPYSRRAYQSWVDLLRREELGLRLVVKHFPLDRDSYAYVAALGALKAQERGAGEAVLQGLFALPTPFTESRLRAFFAENGLLEGSDSLLETLGASGTLTTLDQERQMARELNVEGTPTVFINGIKLAGLFTERELLPLLRDQVRLADTLVELTGSQGDDLYREMVEVNQE